MSTFKIEAPLMGAVRTTQRQKWVDPRYKRYQAWKSRVRLVANTAGVPQELDPKKSYRVEIAASWEKRAKCDGDNLCKGVLDALWKNDRRVMSICVEMVEGSGLELAVVVVEEM